MRCKPGDLVVNVGGLTECIGEIYTVIEAYSGGILDSFGPAWWVDHKGTRWHCLDCHLRPLRDNDGEDEVIRIAGKPQKETA